MLGPAEHVRLHCRIPLLLAPLAARRRRRARGPRRRRICVCKRAVLRVRRGGPGGGVLCAGALPQGRPPLFRQAWPLRPGPHAARAVVERRGHDALLLPGRRPRLRRPADGRARRAAHLRFRRRGRGRRRRAASAARGRPRALRNRPLRRRQPAPAMRRGRRRRRAACTRRRRALRQGVLAETAPRRLVEQDRLRASTSDRAPDDRNHPCQHHQASRRLAERIRRTPPSTAAP
mmetsp:Transcript_18236/g.62868  ORF Transcript_18236/g.62868 Transcript_18236/m.62868 type:complete len:233 (-) Transcript_18236:11-709(-)